MRPPCKCCWSRSHSIKDCRYDNAVLIFCDQLLAPQPMLCNGCGKIEKGSGGWDMPAGWVAIHDPPPCRHYCLDCQQTKHIIGHVRKEIPDAGDPRPA